MTPEERNVIGAIFDRLREAAYQPRDPEAERFIADRLREQPYAPYAMAQSIYVQEQALNNMSQQVEQLQAEVARLRQSAPAAPQQSGGFLSGIFGGGGQRPASVPSFGQPQRAPAQPAYAAAPQPQGGPWGGQPQPQQGGFAPQAAPQRGGMGFLGTALTTAAGVAGGMVVGNALMNAFNSHGGASGLANSLGFGEGKGDQSASSGAGDSSNYDSTAGYQDPGQQDAGYDNASYEDESGGFDGGGDDGDWT